MNEKINELVQNYQARYSYVACGREALERAAKSVMDFPRDVALDLMNDYIISQGLAEEIAL